MNSLESIQILARSYAVRYRECAANETLVWQFKPIKKSINWAIWRKVDTKLKDKATAGAATAGATANGPPMAIPKRRNSKQARQLRRRSTADGTELGPPHEEKKLDLKEKLESVGMEEVVSGGRCEGGQIQKGTYNVSRGGMYALVFDNTFSVNTPKTVFFILSNHPVSLPPILRDPSADLSSITDSSLATTFSGILYKKRRKKLQGYAKRYFTLSVTTGELSYCQNSHNPLLRGTIPLALAALNIDYGRREFILDSGADIWHLRASNESEFEIWKTRLEDVWLKAVAGRQRAQQDEDEGIEISSDWKTVEGLVDRLSMMKDFVRGMVTDVNAEAVKSREPSLLSVPGGSSVKPVAGAASNEAQKGIKIFKRNKEKGVVAPTSPPREPSVQSPNAPSLQQHSHEVSVYDNLRPKLASLDQNLESILASFHTVLSNLRPTKEASTSSPGIPVTPSRRVSIGSARASIESTADDWFDAQSIASNGIEGGLITVVEQETESDHRHDESSEDDDDLAALRDGAISPLLTMAPNRLRTAVKKELYPLAELRAQIVKRRQTLPVQITVPPPSLVAFLRKNVGKDFSTIAMPVTSNEPTTLLQRFTEDLEYSTLLDQAATTTDPHLKLLLLATFATSSLSSVRSPKRVLRKPFTPLLAETYELVREDKGWRFLAEKVSHRPQIFATHADSEKWTWSFCPSPRQKFWGKSFEMTIEGTIRVVLVPTGEVITWSKPACYMRNLITGEKYIEPVGEIVVWNHTMGGKAIVEFIAEKGIWAGRSENVVITTYSKEGNVGLRAEGKWSQGIKQVPEGHEIWKVGNLVENEEKYGGFPVFASQLSEITTIEEAKLPPTDSRLRSDRKTHELGKMDEAEKLKIQLEEDQRVRRREGREPGVQWFKKVTLETEGLRHQRTASGTVRNNTGIGSDSEDGEEQVWRIKEGKEGYWARRERGDWSGVFNLW